MNVQDSKGKQTWQTWSFCWNNRNRCGHKSLVEKTGILHITCVYV